MLNLINNLKEVFSDINDVSLRTEQPRNSVQVLGRLPGFFPGQGVKTSPTGEKFELPSPYKYTKRANRFLEIQEKRIIVAIQEKNYTKAVFL